MLCQPSFEPLTQEEQDWSAHHFDATDIDRMQDPFRLFRYLRHEHPIAYSDAYGDGFWVLSRYDDVRSVARDHRRFISSSGVSVTPLGNERPMIPIETDPPDHAKYRRLIGDLFTAKAMASQEDNVRSVTRELINAILSSPDHSSDLVRELAYEQPMRVMWAEPFLGDPLRPIGSAETAASTTFREWVHDFKHDPIATESAASKMRSHVEKVLRNRTKHPRDDIPSRLLSSDIDDQPMPFEEAADFLFTLFSAGTATTGDALSGCLLYLATHPRDAERLRRGELDMALATEELIRYFGPSQSERRTAIADVELDGVEIRSGDSVQLLWNSANRDERIFTSPEEVVLDRDPNPHIAFGAGIHRCVGLHLARLQIRVVVEEWLKAVPEFWLIDGAELRWSVGLDRSLQSLIVGW